MPELVSVMPHEGFMALYARPFCSSVFRKRSQAVKFIASPPLSMNLQQLRSTSSAGIFSCSSITRPYAKFGAHVRLTRKRSMSFSHFSGSVSISAVSTCICDAWSYTSSMWYITSPPTWSRGIQLSETSFSSKPYRCEVPCERLMILW